MVREFAQRMDADVEVRWNAGYGGRSRRTAVRSSRSRVGAAGPKVPSWRSRPGPPPGLADLLAVMSEHPADHLFLPGNAYSCVVVSSA
jgi:hypothetical protein